MQLQAESSLTTKYIKETEKHVKKKTIHVCLKNMRQRNNKLSSTTTEHFNRVTVIRDIIIIEISPTTPSVR